MTIQTATFAGSNPLQGATAHPALVRRLLLARGADPEDALELSTISRPLGKQGMMGMKEAVDWIAHAVAQQWPATIVGD